jgi:HEAT repeat protein
MPPRMFQPSSLPRTFDACLRDLGSTKVGSRAGAASDLVRHAKVDPSKRDEIVSRLERALSDEAPAVRSAAAIALADLRAESAVPKLLVAIDDDDDHVRQMALTALGEIGDARATPRLARALSDERPEVRYQAIIAFPRVCDDAEDVARALATATRDDDFNIRYIALRLAEEHSVRDARVLERAARLLDDEASDVGVAAAILLTKAGDERGHDKVLAIARGVLAAQKEDEREAVESCGSAGLRRAIPDLERRAFGLASKVRDTCSFHAIVALARLGHPRAIASIERDLAARSLETRQAAVVAAGRARLTSARAIIAQLRDVDADLRDEALAALDA